MKKPKKLKAWWSELRAYYKTDRWRDLAVRRLLADSHICRLCGEPATLVHHRKPESIGHEDVNGLTSLCRDCACRYYLLAGYCQECIETIFSQVNSRPGESRPVNEFTEE